MRHSAQAEPPAAAGAGDRPPAAGREVVHAPGDRTLPRGGPLRSLLKRLYYSWPFRRLLYGPLDLAERALGRRDPLMPPRRLQYVGRGDFEAQGALLRELLVGRGLGADTDFLDIGCGVGRAAIALVGVIDGGSYRGFDIVPAGIEWCRREISSRHPNFRFELADVNNRQYNPRGGTAAAEYSFPYEDESFDLALASSVFTHMRPDGTRRYLSEAARVLRPGGQLLCEFFLLDEIGLEVVRRGDSAFALDHRFEDPSGVGFLASDGRVPEYNVALAERDLEAIAAAAGLDLVAIEFGRWTGRRGGPQGRFQDLVTLVKPVTTAA